MRVLKDSFASCQASSLEQSAKGFLQTQLKITLSLKKINNALKKSTKECRESNVDVKLCKETTISENSKKIHKLSTRPYNRRHLKKKSIETPTRTCHMSLRSNKVFLEDGTRLTKEFEVLKYDSSHGKEELKFMSFAERDLDIPASYSNKLLPRTLDNDCTTDEDQIKDAIDDLYESLKEALIAENKHKKKGKKDEKK